MNYREDLEIKLQKATLAIQEVVEYVCKNLTGEAKNYWQTDSL